MKNDFICPHCRTVLNPNEEIIMLVSKGGAKHLILFSARIGDYTIHTSPEVDFEAGEVVDFMCPACHWSFRSPVADDISEVLLRDKEGAFSRVGFSRTYGKQATFLIDEEDVKGFGEDAAAYRETNWFGAGRFWEGDQI